MLDDDIFSCICSYNHLSFASKEMSSQHQLNLQSNIDVQPHSSRIQAWQPTLEEEYCQELSFTQINFFPVQTQSAENNEYFNEDSYPSPSMEESVEPKASPQRKTISKATNNAADYIIKHCLKKMITPQYKKQVSSYCQELGLQYQAFVESWRNKIKELMPRHIGINRFEKMMRSQSQEVEVLKWFMVVYVQHDYMLYLFKSSIENKTAYIDCAIKLIYTAQVSQEKTYDLILQAQMGLGN